MSDVLPQLPPVIVLQIICLLLGVICWQTAQELPWQQFPHARLSFLLLTLKVGLGNTHFSFNTTVH